jgi:hypothetical protein
MSAKDHGRTPYAVAAAAGVLNLLVMMALTVQGWEEWELDDDLKVKSSPGWYDENDYARRVEGK